MDFEWCFGTFVPCFGGQTTKGGQEPAKHGIDHTPDPVAMQWPCLPEHKLRTLRTRSVRRASGLVQTALSEKCGPPGVVLGAKTRFAPELVPVESSALRQVTGFRTGRGARALSRIIGSSTAGLGSGPCTSAVCALYVLLAALRSTLRGFQRVTGCHGRDRDQFPDGLTTCGEA